MRSVLVQAVTWGMVVLVASSSRGAEPKQGCQQEQAILSVIERVKPALVSLWFGDPPASHATGTIITADGLVLTCAHILVPAGGTVEARTADGRKFTVSVLAKTTNTGEWGNDLALVQLPGEGPWPFVNVGATTSIALDVPLLAFGYPMTGVLSNPGDLPPCYVRLGYRVAYENTDKAGMVRTTIRGAGGDSGGPVLDLSGNIVGVTTNFDPGGTGLTFNTVDRLRSEWKTLAGNRRPLPIPEGSRPTFASLDQELAAAVASVRAVVVEVRSQERCIAAGVVVGRGEVLTKASELGPDLTAVLAADRVGVARIEAVDRVTDLALLSIPEDMTEGVPPVTWAHAADLEPGRFVAAVPPAAFAPMTGILIANTSPIPPTAGGVGVDIKDGMGGVEVTRIWKELIPQRLQYTFPLRVGDTITHVQGVQTANTEEWIHAFERWPTDGERPRLTGEPITVRYQRGGVEAEAIFPLHASSNIKQYIRPYSVRYTGYPKAAIAQMHVTRPELCGSPVVDLAGNIIGVYIAKSPDVEDIILPAVEVHLSLDRLRKRRLQDH
jgi:serine protease Do